MSVEARNLREASAARFECRLALKHSDFIMQNHRVHGVSVLPGVAFLDMVYRVLLARAMDPGRASLHRVTFSEAVTTREDFSRDIRLTFEEEIDGCRTVRGDSRWSRGGRARSDWRESFRCELTFAAPVDPRQIEIEALERAAARERDVAVLYERARAEGIRHGRPMTAFGSLFEGEGSILARLSLSSEVAASEERFYLHPAKLDASTLVGFAQLDLAGRDPFIPVFIERFWATGALRRAEYVWVPAREELSPSGDVLRNSYVLCDGRGQVIAGFDDIHCQRIRHARLITRLVEGIEERGNEPAADSSVRRESASESPARALGYADHLRSTIARRLHRATEEVQTSTGFYDLGLDSLEMLEIGRELEPLVGATLYPTLLFEFTNIEALAAHLTEKYGECRQAVPRPAPVEPEPSKTEESELLLFEPTWSPGSSTTPTEDGAPLDLVVFGGAPALTEALRRRLAARGGRVIAVDRDGAFAELGPDRFSADLRIEEHVRQVLAARRGDRPACFVHVAPARHGSQDLPVAELDAAFLELRALARALVASGPAAKLLHVSSHGEEPVPAAAAAARVLSHEAPTLSCRSIELSRCRPGEAADAILAEARDSGSETEVRYLGARREVRRFLRLRQEEAPLAGLLKPDGAYLLTGGAGGLGRLLTDYLARRYRARALLTGRRAAPAQLQGLITRCGELGSEVRYHRADLASESDVLALVEEARRVLGRIDGVFHCAGEVRDGLFFEKDARDVEAVLVPKLRGTVHLDRALADERLDFFVLFSSIASAVPNAGQSEYAFANAFLESFAELRASRSDRYGKTLAIAWPLWDEGGMRPPAAALRRSIEATGMQPLPTALGLETLERALAGSSRRLVVAYGDPGKIHRAIPVASSTPQAETGEGRALDGARREPADVAVIGIAGQYPGATDLEAFWKNLAAGRDCITEVPPERWDHDLFYSPDGGEEGKTNSKWGGFLAGVDEFEPTFFGISRREAEGMDPQERLFLKTCWRTLEDAAYSPASLASETVGVFAGVMWTHYALCQSPSEPVLPTALHASIANRVSYSLDLTGPSVALDTACSSSLTAIHFALASIARGECSMALAGGVNVTVHPQKYLQLARGKFLSSDGRCRAFGAGGNGYVPGEGVGAVLLKALDRAVADGDQIYGVLKGSSLNHTGRTSGFTVPSPPSQAAVIRAAAERAGMSGEAVSYIEAHGTGTSLGDPIEIEGLRQAFAGAGLSPAGCAVGSVKSNIGHLESAAGIAGLTKVLLQMKYRQIVPSLHSGELNPHIDLSDSPFYVPQKTAPWTPRPDGKLAAGVSSFGAGGANAHLLVESQDPPPRRTSPGGEQLFVLSARNAEALTDYARAFVAFLERRTGSRDDTLRTVLVRAVADLLDVPAEAVDAGETLADLGLDGGQVAVLASSLSESFRDLEPAAVTPSSTIDELVPEGAGSAGAAGPVELDELCYTLQVGRAPMAARLAIVAADLPGLRAELEGFVRGEPDTSDRLSRHPAEIETPESPGGCLELFRKGRLRELAKHWVAGAEPPWTSCHRGAGHSLRRISLPTYPFQEERCWLGRWRAAARSEGAVPGDAQPPRASVEPALEPEESDSVLGFRVLDHGVALLRMRDVANNNMFSEELVRELEQAFEEIEQRPGIKAVILTGSDAVFSMGATPGALERLAAKRGSFTDVPFLYEGLLKCSRPVIAAIQGHAFGGGLVFGLYADVVVLSLESVYAANFMKYGFTPGMGATCIVEEKLGKALAAEMFLTARPFSGEELAQRGAPVLFRPREQVLQSAIELARSIVDKPAPALRALKTEMAARVLERLPEIVGRETRMHERVLGQDAAERVSEHFEKITRRAPATPGARSESPLASGTEGPPAGVTEASPESTRSSLSEFVHAIEEALCGTLYLAAHEIDPERTFHEMGVDSVGAVEIVAELNRRFGLALDSVVIYDRPTIDRLAELMVEATGDRAETGNLAVAEAGDASEPAALDVAAPLPVAEVRPAPLGVRPIGLPRKSSGPVALKPLHGETPRKAPEGDGERGDGERPDVAVIGMSGRFPDAPDLSAFWENLAAGRSSVREVPAARWGEHETRGRRAALLDSVDRFDAGLFNISPLEAEAMDPQQRLFLEEAWAAMEDAGYATGADRKTRCGVYVGCSEGEYDGLLSTAGARDTGEAFLGNSASVLAARIAYFLNLTGPAVALDTACSSSLVAVHMACESIRGGECEMSLAGGVALMLTPQLFRRTGELGILSPSGRCAAFDDSADGIVLGEGVGVVVLKRLDRALEDRDQIYAVIRASGMNGDGRTNGLTAPSADSQTELINRVWRKAGLTPAQIDYVEAHGTGTDLGDPIEIKALRAVLQKETARTSLCGVGSVKTNIGHTTMAAGVASLIKVVLALRRRQLPPSLHFATLNRKIEADRGLLEVVTGLREWPRTGLGLRAAGVSSFGFSGTNCHVVLTESPAARPGSGPGLGWFLLPVSARSERALALCLERLRAALSDRVDLQDVAYTLAVGRRHFAVRAAFVVSGRDDLERQLAAWTGSPLAGLVPDGGSRAVSRPERLRPDMDPETLRSGLERIAEAYREGADLDWVELYRECPGRRVSLPAYPFERERFWIEPEGSRELQFEPGEWLVSNHRVADVPVLPAAESLRRFAEAASQDGAGGPVRLCEVRWLRLFEVDRARVARIATARESGKVRLELTVPGTEALYASSVVGAVPATRLEEVLDIGEIRSRCAARRDREELYQDFSRAGIEYGPPFRLLDEIARGTDEAVAKIEAPGSESGWPSTVLDGALQMASVLKDPEDHGTLVPFSVDSVDFLRPVPASGFVHARRASGQRFDVRLADQEGRVCVRFQGFALRPSKALPETEALPETVVLIPRWREAPGRPRRGLDAAEGRTAVLYRSGAGELAEALLSVDGEAATQGFELRGGELPEGFDGPYETIYLLAGDGESGALVEESPAWLDLFRLVKHILRDDGSRHRALTLKVVAHGVVPVTGADPVRPHAAALIGLARTVAAEHPRWSVCCVDAGVATGELADTAGAIREESAASRWVALRGGKRFVRSFEPFDPPRAPPAAPFRAGGHYLIAGGAGGVGFALSRRLAESSRASLTWLGRRAPTDPEIRERARRVEALGGRVRYLQADVADVEAVSTAIAKVCEELGPLRGVFHSAVVLCDKTLARLDEADFRRVLAPKVEGAVALWEAVRGEELDFLVFFSSAASFVDAAGQGNYAAASTFEDAFAAYARQRSCFPVSVVNWGYWGGVGAVAEERYRRRFDALGVGSLEPDEAFSRLESLLASGTAQALVISASPEQLATHGITVAPAPGTGPEILGRSRRAFRALEELSLRLLERAFSKMPGAPPAGQEVPLDELEARMVTDRRYRRFFRAMLDVLQRGGRLRIEGGRVEVLEGSRPEEDLKGEDLVGRFPELAPHVRLLRSSVDSIAEVLAGRKHHLEALFPGGDLDLAEQVYKGQAGADYFHRLLAAEVGRFLDSPPDGVAGGPFRIVELGAGTGAATGFVLEVCAATGIPFEYCYTDDSPAFLQHGDATFGERYPSLSCRLLDIDREPGGQGFAPRSYDVVLATNVLHAAARIERALEHARELLKPGGLLLINEVTRTYDFLTLTFGLTPGWWAFDDPQSRLADSPLLGPAQWRQELEKAGFESVRVAGEPGSADEQCVFSARRPVPAAGRTLDELAHVYVEKVFVETLKLRGGELLERVTFEELGIDSLIGMKILDRMERDFDALPSTLLFEHPSVERLCDYLVAERGGELARVMRPGSAEGGGARLARREPPAAKSVPEGSGVALPERSPSPGGGDAGIAIVGLSGRYPSSPDLETFWRNLASGADCIREIPAERWDWREHFDARPGRRNKTYSRWGGFLEDVDRFDPQFFNVLPRDAENMDPQERLFLETAWNLLEEAGYVGESRRATRTGVFVGVMYGSYGRLGAARWPRGEFVGAQSNYWSLANRVSYFFDFRGPSLALDSACSSSLAAVHLACESLRRGECEMAIAGGVNVILHPAHFVSLCSLNMLSSGPGCKVFDEQADGFVPGEGVGAVLLKPLEAACRDGDRIWAVIKGGAMNAGGRTSGYTVPNPNAQAEVVAEALRRADVAPRTVSFVEAHGTGTRLGDPIEVAGLTKAFGRRNGAGAHCAIGSVKANVGHLEGAAGIAGLTKVVLQLRHRKLVPCVGLREINPRIDFESSPFYLPRTLEDWHGPGMLAGGRQSHPRRAGVSSFGAGGANVHLVLEEPPDEDDRPGDRHGESSDDAGDERLFVLSARSPRRLRRYAARVGEYLDTPEGGRSALAELAYASQVGRLEMEHRLAVAARSVEDLGALLQAFSRGETDPRIYTGSSRERGGRLFDGREGEAFLEGLARAKNLAKLAESWVLGARVPWPLLWQGVSVRCAAFPTSPFEKKRYWIPSTSAVPEADTAEADTAEADTAEADTAEADTAPADTADREGFQIRERSLSGDAFYLHEHRVHGSRWLPAAAMLDIVSAEWLSESPPGAFQLRDVVFRSPCDLDRGPDRLQISYRSDGAATRFRLGGPDGSSTIYAQGVITELLEDGAEGDLAELEDRCARDREVRELYEGLAEGGLEHGPRFRVVSAIHVGDGECLAELTLPAGTETEPQSFALHPALLDGAVQSVAVLCDDGYGYVPAAISRLDRHAALPPVCRVHAREIEGAPGAARRRFDLRIFDTGGRGLVTIADLEVARVRPSRTVCRYRRSVWEKVSPAPPGRAPERTLILTSSASLADRVAHGLEASGTRCARAVAGSPFRRQGPLDFELDPDDSRQCERLVRELSDEGWLPDAIVHYWSRQSFSADPRRLEQHLEHGFHSLFRLVTAILAKRTAEPLRVVYGLESSDGAPQPQYSAMAGMLRTLALEHRRFSGVQVAFSEGPGAVRDDLVAGQLVAELLAGDEGVREVRREHGERWQKGLETFDPELTADPELPSLTPGGVYLISGGAGELAGRFASYLAESGAGRIVLVGRSAATAELQGRVRRLGASGASVEYEPADVTDPARVRDLVARVKNRHGALHGVLHAAGVLDDALAVEKTRAQLDRVIAPKVFGAVHLDEATRDEALDFFVLFSSLAAETGNLGQADYTFANAFLNEFAALRESWQRSGLRRGKTLSIGWPLWSGGGMDVDPATARLLERKWGMVPLPVERGLRAFRDGLRGPDSCVLVLEELAGGAAGSRPVSPASSAGPPAPDVDLRAVALRDLRAMATRFLLVEEREVDPDVDLMELGFDSISLTELINEINDRYALDLLPTVLFDCTNLSSVAEFLCRHHADALARHGVPEVAPGEPSSEPPRDETAVAAVADGPARPAAASGFREDAVAIVGVAGRMPGSEDLDQFWRRLADGDELLTAVPPDREDLVASPLLRDVRGGFLDRIDAFDAEFFAISPREAALMDPQQRLFLETAWQAIQDAGYRPSGLRGRAIGLFAGVGTSDYGALLQRHGVEVQAHTATGVAHSILANRISYLLDLRGPSEAVDTACSSSLVAIHRAVRAIQSGECEMAIAGGVNVILSEALFEAFSKAGMLSGDGRCKVFDGNADGYVRGEGSAAVVLKRLDEAVADGDPIHAVILATAVSHGGKTSSLTAPSAEAQARVLLDAYRRAAIEPSTVSYLEAHGTGTRLGDPIEIEGIKKAFSTLYEERGREVPGRAATAIGSVKANAGHLEAAAGVAGVLKVLLCMRHGRLPGNIHYREPNPLLRLDGTPFYIPDRCIDWTGAIDPSGRAVRRAGVSSFGFGGTNAHIVLEAYREAPGDAVPGRDGDLHCIVLSAPSAESLRRYARRVGDFLAAGPAVGLAALARTLQDGREELPERLAVVASDRQTVIDALSSMARTGEAPPGTFRGSAPPGAPARPAVARRDDVRGVAEAWVRGASVDWDELWTGPKPRRLSLPGFPFKRTRHWFSSDDAPAAPRSPAAERPAPLDVTRRGKIRLSPCGPASTAPEEIPVRERRAPAEVGAEVPVAPPTRVPAIPSPISTVVREGLATILGLEPETLPGDVSFMDLGLDSIYCMDLVRHLNAALSLELQSAVLFEHDCVDRLAEHIAGLGAPPPADSSRRGEDAQAELIVRLIGRPLDLERTFADNGLTSFEMLAVVSELQQHFGALPKTLLFTCPTLGELAAYLADGHGHLALERLSAGLDDPGSPPAAERASALPRDERPWILARTEVEREPEARELVRVLDEAHALEGGLAGRVIAPFLFLGSARRGYFNFGRRGDLALAFSYVGPEDYLEELTAEWVELARERSWKPNLLSMKRLEDVAGTAFSATPFGVVQRLDLGGFTLGGTRMRRLRYLVNKFGRSGSCHTVEHRSGSDALVDERLARLLDQWCETKEMVNPYVARVRAEIAGGALEDRYRIFLTYRDDSLANAVIITRMPAEGGYLLDMELYPKDAPLGGLEFTIVRIFETLRAEGYGHFSFGASFGVQVTDSPNTDPELEQELRDLRASGLFNGEPNAQFKRKFRPRQEPIYLCRPVGEANVDASAIALAIASPAQPRDESAVRGAAGSAPGEGRRGALLAAHGFNPLRIPPQDVELDMLTDSWAELDAAFVHERRSALQALVSAGAGVAEPDASYGLPFSTVIPCVSGRAAEALLCQVWSRSRRLVVQNAIFPSWAPPLAEKGFLPVPMAVERDPGTGSSGSAFRGDVDVARLEALLEKRGDQVAFLCVELSNNAGGGHPIALSNLVRIKAAARSRDVPVVLDATRLLENAFFVAEHEDEQRGRDVWEIARDLLLQSDVATLSLSKDFGIDFGGLVGTSDPRVASRLEEHVRSQGHQVGLAQRRTMAVAMADREYAARKVRERMRAVELLWQTLRDVGAPVVAPAAGHCVVLDVGRIPELEDLRHPVPAFLAWLYRAAGVRGAPHLPGLQTVDSENKVRLAIPLGLSADRISALAEPLAKAFRALRDVVELVPLGGSSGPIGSALAEYREAGRPVETRSGNGRPKDARSANFDLLRAHAPAVKRVLARRANGVVEAFSAGRGEPLLMMHGFNIGAGAFAGQFRELAASHRVMSIHHPGVGLTDAGADLTLHGLAGLCADVLPELGVDSPLHVAGTSFGGLVAQMFALRFPERVASLTLVCSSHKAGNRSGRLASLQEVLSQDLDQLERLTGSERIRRERREFESLLLRAESMDPETGLRYLDVFEEETSLLPRLSEIRAPVLVIYGTCDSVIDAETIRRICRAIPHARCVEIADAGHFPLVTHAREVNEILAGFIAGCARAGSRAAEVVHA